MCRMLVLAAAIVAAGGAAVGGAPSVASADPRPTDLTIEYLAKPGAMTQWFTLTCEPTGGDHFDPVGACARLAEISGDPFAPVPPDAICAHIWGGPETARITGWWGSQFVDARFDRINSCEITRWDRLVPVLPPHKN